jgi:hypothetical protein
MSGILRGAFLKRASGETASPIQAALAAAVAGTAAGVLTYRILRS